MIVVTGGTGFVGREICRSLLAEGLPVRALARTPPSHPLPAGVHFFPADITNPASLREAFRGAQAVIHCVGIIQPHGSQTFNRVHQHGTAHVVAASQSAGVSRFLHLSALGTRPMAASHYHQSKWAAEEIVRHSDLAFTVFRPSLIYGKEDAFTSLLASWMRPPLSWLSGGFLPLPGGVDAILRPLSVADVASAVVRSLGQTSTVGQTLDLCGPETNLRDFALAIARAMGLTPTWVEQPPDVVLTMLPWLWLTAKKPVLYPMPLKLCRLLAAVAERVLPRSPLTTDQILMLEEGQWGDSTLATKLLGFQPSPLSSNLASYLAPRTGGIADRRS